MLLMSCHYYHNTRYARTTMYYMTAWKIGPPNSYTYIYNCITYGNSGPYVLPAVGGMASYAHLSLHYWSIMSFQS